MYLGYNCKINPKYVSMYPKYILTPLKEFDFSLNYK